MSNFKPIRPGVELSFQYTVVTKEQALSYIYCSDIKANLSSTREGWEYGEGGCEESSFHFFFFSYL